MGTRGQFGSSHGNWSKFLAYSGNRINTADPVAKKYIVQSEVKKQVKEALVYDTVLKIVESYGMAEEKYKHQQYTVEMKIIKILDYCEKMSVDELVETLGILKKQGLHKALIYMNKGKPVINKSFT